MSNLENEIGHSFNLTVGAKHQRPVAEHKKEPESENERNNQTRNDGMIKKAGNGKSKTHLAGFKLSA